MAITEKAKCIRRALLIDDDEVVHFINRFTIEQLYVVDECISHYDGATALQMLRDEQMMGISCPDVIFLDLNMPIMDGLEFLQQLHEQAGLSFLLKRIIMLTSSSAAQDMAKVSQLGVRWHLTKPLLREALAPILTTMLQGS